MLREELIPTPLIGSNERERIEIVVPAADVRYRSVRILQLFLRFMLDNLRLRLRGRLDARDRAVRLRRIFEDLGGLWIKIGQLLSLRTDILSAEVCEQLSRLQYRAVGFPPAIALATIRLELGDDFGRHFLEFDETPLAAASICQVHRARLRNPAVNVVVKVQRPGIEEIFRRDFRLVGGVIGFMDRFGIMRHMRWRDALWELEQILQEELDYRYEASNARRMRKVLRRHGIYVPKVFHKESSARVLVMEFIDGALMSDFIRVGENDPARLAGWCRVNNVEPRKVGRRLFVSVMRQLLEDNLFHADVHPGNIILLRDSRIALIDFGTIGTSEHEFLATYKSSLSALASLEFTKAADYTLRLAMELPANGIGALRSELVHCYRKWEARTHLRGLTYHEKSLSSAGTESGRIMFAYRVQLTWSFMKISRTWGTLDASLNLLMPDVDYIKVFRAYFRDAQRRAHRPLAIAHSVVGAARDVRQTLREYNLLVAPIVRRRSLGLDGAADKAARFVAANVRFFRLALVLALPAAIYVFADQFYSRYLPFRVRILDEVARDVPHLAFGWWILIFLAAFLALRHSGRMIRTLEQSQWRSP